MKTSSPQGRADQFLRLVEVVARLRGPGGCPWDREQTSRSLTAYIIEEAHELVEAIESGQPQDVIEELGDFLFQVILQAQIAEDNKLFEINEVIQRLAEKMIRRHPHVFGAETWNTSSEVLSQWDNLKDAEKKREIFSFPKTLPALQASHKIGSKSSQWNFDWDSLNEKDRILSVLEKVEEEIRELREAIESATELSPSTFQHKLETSAETETHIFHEMGDCLFALAQLSRHLGFHAEASLREGNRRFQLRFETMVKSTGLSKDDFKKLSPEARETAWQATKVYLESQQK